MNNATATSKRLNVLALDGGGVRGLSSLLILQALMAQINQALMSRGGVSSQLEPQDVFQLVGGTSTGGLIALMLGKMGMTVDECITQYGKLSKVIFGKRHFRGRISHGLAPARYSGERLKDCVRKLLSDRQLDEDLFMRHGADGLAWYVHVILGRFSHDPFRVDVSQSEPYLANISITSAVICREHSSSSEYSRLKPRAVPICSLPCEISILCKVCDAARATSAAPTFFPVMNIDDRLFVDGGLEHNNPSFALYFHYSALKRKASCKPPRASTSAPLFSPHGDLDFSRVRYTNIGTGAKADDVEPRRRDRFADLVPSTIRRLVSLTRTLTEIAVDSKEKEWIMRTLQDVSGDALVYERFDANHGVSNIKLDAHNALQDIRERTEQYLEEPQTKDLLKEVGLAIATDYLQQRPSLLQNTQPADPAINQSHQRSNDAISMSTSCSLSSSPSSHSNRPESEIQDLFAEHDNLHNGGPISSSKHPAKIVHQLLPQNGQGQPENYAHEDSEIGDVEA